jgi:hypothetical protein
MGGLSGPAIRPTRMVYECAGGGSRSSAWAIATAEDALEF